MSQSAPGAAGASCASASRFPTSASRRCCARAAESTRSSRRTPTARARRTRCSATRSPACRAPTTRWSAPSATTSTRASATAPRAFPRFTDPRLRGPDGYRDYLRMAVERSLERCGVDSFDLLLLHNPDRRGFESPEVWEALRELRDEGLTRELGLAPGPANGFTLDVIGCFERYGELIDWAMLILNPFEPWPGELALDAAAAARREGAHARGGLRRALPRRRAPGTQLRAARPPRLPARGLGRGRARAARADPPDRAIGTGSRRSSSPACGTWPTTPSSAWRPR